MLDRKRRERNLKISRPSQIFGNSKFHPPFNSTIFAIGIRKNNLSIRLVVEFLDEISKTEVGIHSAFLYVSIYIYMYV